MQGSEASGNIVQGNFIGTDVTGLVALGNGTDCCHSGIVLHLGANNNTIGGTAAGAGNVISGNTADGVTIVDIGTTANVIAGNFIGTDITGTQDVGNSFDGVLMAAGASNNLIGGTEAGAANVISGNTGDGVTIIDAGTNGNVVQGNFIGTDVSGTALLANDGKGVAIFTGAANNLIGGTSSQARNIISGNSDTGVVIYGEGVSNNTVQGNYIGTDVSGTLALGNTGYGIFIGSVATDNTIGGLTAGARNLISGNSEHGIGIFDNGTTGNTVQGNYIGTDVSGALPLGNSRSGIALGDALNNMVGGITLNAGNTIAFNDESGVVIYNESGNAILSNSIHSNGGLGIDLGDDGVTANDLFDADSGANNLQNFPVITMVKSTSKGTVVQGVLISSANTTFRLEFFSNNACDPSGYGEGQNYVGFATVKTNITGHVNFRFTLPTSIAVGKFVTATATDPANNTSELSRCMIVSP